MTIKWNKAAVKSLIAAIEFIEENGFPGYAEQLEQEILHKNQEPSYRSFTVSERQIPN